MDKVRLEYTVAALHNYTQDDFWWLDDMMQSCLAAIKTSIAMTTTAREYPFIETLFTDSTTWTRQDRARYNVIFTVRFHGTARQGHWQLIEIDQDENSVTVHDTFRQPRVDAALQAYLKLLFTKYDLEDEIQYEKNQEGDWSFTFQHIISGSRGQVHCGPASISRLVKRLLEKGLNNLPAFFSLYIDPPQQREQPNNLLTERVAVVKFFMAGMAYLYQNDAIRVPTGQGNGFAEKMELCFRLYQAQHSFDYILANPDERTCACGDVTSTSNQVVFTCYQGRCHISCLKKYFEIACGITAAVTPHGVGASIRCPECTDGIHGENPYVYVLAQSGESCICRFKIPEVRNEETDRRKRKSTQVLRREWMLGTFTNFIHNLESRVDGMGALLDERSEGADGNAARTAHEPDPRNDRTF